MPFCNQVVYIRMGDTSPRGYRGVHRAPWSAQRWPHVIGRWVREIQIWVYLKGML